MALDGSESGETMKEKMFKIHELAEEALSKMQHLADLLQEDDTQNDLESEEYGMFRSFPEAQKRPLSNDSQATSCRPLTEEHMSTDDAHFVPFNPKDDFEGHFADGSSGDERASGAAENESATTASSLFNVPHRAWEVEIFLKDAELNVENRIESHNGTSLMDGWIDDLKAQRMKLMDTQKKTAMEGRRGIEAVRKVQKSLAEIEVAFSQSQKREPITLDALAAIREELKLLQEAYRKCALDKHAQSLQMAHDHETRAEENKKVNEAVDSLILRHKAEVSSLRLEIVRMQNSNERNLASLKDEVKVLLETRIPKEQFQQVEKQNRKIRVAVEDAQKESLAAAVALSAERESRIEEMRRNDQKELRAQQNIELWQNRCRKLDSSLSTVMMAYERANLDWPFDEHFQIIDISKDPGVAVALPPTPAMLAIAAEKLSAKNRLFDLERENGELRIENERLHENYASSIVQNDEDRLKIDALNAEIKKLAAETENIQKKAKSSLAIASAKTKAAASKIVPVVVQFSSVESQTEPIELCGDELKEFQNNQRLQSVAGLMLNQLESRSEVNRILHQSVEDVASGLNKSLIEGEYFQHEALQFMARMRNALEGLVIQNAQLVNTAAGERNLLLKRLQQALSSNDNMRREIDYLKCMSLNVFCENTEDDPTLGPLMHQHSVSIQTDSAVDQNVKDDSLIERVDGNDRSNRQYRVGKPVIPSRKAALGNEMLQLRSAMMAWMASTVSKTFFAWKNIVWFGACMQSPQLDATTMIVEMQKCGNIVAQQLAGAVSDLQSVCQRWSATLSTIAETISKEKAVKDLGDKFFSNRNQMQSIISLSEHVTSLQYQNTFHTLQENLLDDHKQVLLSARRSEEVVTELKNEISCLKTRNMKMLDELDGLTKLVEELTQKLKDEEARQHEWCTHVEVTADVWARQLLQLVEQEKALFDQNETFRKLLIEKMEQVKSPLPALIVFEHISADVGASSLCGCQGCKLVRKRLQVVRSAAINVSAKFVSKKQAMFKGADAFLKGLSIKQEKSSETLPKLHTTSPQKDHDVESQQDDHVLKMLDSAGARQTMLRVMKQHMKITKLESECANLREKMNELHLLNDYLRSKLRNQEDRNIDGPASAGCLSSKSGHQSMANSRQTTPRSVSHTTPVQCSSVEKSFLIIENSSTNVTLQNNSEEYLRAGPNSQHFIHGMPRLIKSAGNEKRRDNDSSLPETQTLDVMLDAAHRRIDDMHREMVELRQQTQANDKKSVDAMIERAVKVSNLRLMTQVEQLLEQASESKKKFKDQERQALFERQKVTATYEAQQILLSQQLSSARKEMSRRAVTTIELRREYEVAVARLRSMEAALKSAERQREDDTKTLQQLNDQISKLEIAAAIASENVQVSTKRTRDDVLIEMEVNQNMSISEREQELLGQLLASEDVADAAVALFHNMMKLLAETQEKGNITQDSHAEALIKAKHLNAVLPFMTKNPRRKDPCLKSEPLDSNSCGERDQVCNRKSSQVPKNPLHRSDNALALLKLVDSDFEDMQLVKSVIKRTQLRPFHGVMQQSPRNPVFARVLKPSKQPHGQTATARPHPPQVSGRHAPGS